VNNEVKAVWKCKAENCDYTRPPTLKGYKQLVGHQKEHAHLPKGERGYRLVDENTGEVLAESVREAREKGFLVAEPPPREESEGKPEEKPELGMELTEEGITFPVTLPPVAFTLFDAAKAAKLVDEDKDLDSWLFECVLKRFELDYSLRLMLVPIGEGQ